MTRAASALAAGAAVWLASVVSAAAFDLQGHRGARGLAPENTLPAFGTALSIGATTLELDVGMTKRREPS
jgi:glycerophosphoryl diester phosphodiesterase